MEFCETGFSVCAGYGFSLGVCFRFFALGDGREYDAGVCGGVLRRIKTGLRLSGGVCLRALFGFFGTKLFGNNAFTFTVAACVVYGLSERFDFDGIFPQMLTVFGLTF